MNMALQIASSPDPWLIAAMVVIVVLAGLLVGLYVQNRSLRRSIGVYKTEHVELRRQIDEALSALKESAQSMKAEPGGDRETVAVAEPKTKVAEDGVLSDEDLFIRMEKRLLEGKAFLNPKLSRDDLAAIMGVDKNRFGAIMKEYGQVNSCTVFLNRMRIDYAIMLMNQHPNFTIDAIAKACGMTNTVTFTNYFKRYHDMTPSEYRTRAVHSS
jgi:AraC-like DNA-binding protein